MTLLEQVQSFSRIRGQVAKLLLKHAVDGTDGNNRLTQRDMAEMLGTSWGMVYLSLRSLCHEGIIRINRNKIIVNKELVQKMTEVK
jgi:DNA-binding GntR family transcriptional regulator